MSSLKRGQSTCKLHFQVRQVTHDGAPHLFQVNPVVLVDQDIAEPGHCCPGDCRKAFPCLDRDALRSFSYNLE